MNILNKLTLKHLLMNKKRTIVTIIGIILSTALMVGIGTIASSFREYLVENIKETNGSQHVIFNNVKNDEYKYIKNNANVDKDQLLFISSIGYSKIVTENAYKPYLHIQTVNKNFFNTVKLKNGVFPKNSNELLISDHVNTNGKGNIKIGDILTLDISNRIHKETNEILTQNNPYMEDKEELKLIAKKEYKVVGIIERIPNEPYSAPGYTALTFNEEELRTNLNVYVSYKEIKKVVEKTDNILKAINNPNVVEYYNDGLLSFYGQSSYGNFNAFLVNIILIVLALLAIACATVIYNSFAISVMERKKQFGLFSSIGATSKQIKKTVLFEAFVVSIIGVPLGIISGIGGVWTTILIINQFINEILGASLTITIYPLFIILPIIYMIITILISAYLPAKRAAKISPIEAIRLNDDIKINKKVVKNNKLITKIFGIEGDIAYKNIKRNKKKYRITIISLFISIVLFISFSTFLSMGTRSVKDLFQYDNQDIYVNFSNFINKEDEVDNYVKDINSIKEIDKSTTIKNAQVEINLLKKDINKDGITYYKSNDGYYSLTNNKFILEYVTLFGISDKEYKEYINKMNVKEDKIILINQLKYQNSKMKSYDVRPFNKISNKEVFTTYFDESKENSEEIKHVVKYNLMTSNSIPNSLKDLNIYNNFPAAVVSESMLKNIVVNSPKQDNISVLLAIQTTKYKEVEKKIDKIVNSSENSIYITNIAEIKESNNNLIIVISILLYGFITLVTLIGVTSVFNTINTSMSLRRKEFAVLRSVGLSLKQFNKMILFESLFYGIKSLIYALPVSFGFIILFNWIFNSISAYELVIPYQAIFISIASVFALTFITMNYAVKKQKHENILDVIREENI